jgi:hypothetical protein
MMYPSDEALWQALQLLSRALGRLVPMAQPEEGVFPWEITLLYVAMQQLMMLALERSKLSVRAYQAQARQIAQSVRMVLPPAEAQHLAQLLGVSVSDTNV